MIALKSGRVGWSWRWWVAITAFAVAMALVESAVVVYLRVILGDPTGPIDLDRSVSDAMARRFGGLVATEQWREAATMVNAGHRRGAGGPDARAAVRRVALQLRALGPLLLRLALRLHPLARLAADQGTYSS